MDLLLRDTQMMLLILTCDNSNCGSQQKQPACYESHCLDWQTVPNHQFIYIFSSLIRSHLCCWLDGLHHWDTSYWQKWIICRWFSLTLQHSHSDVSMFGPQVVTGASSQAEYLLKWQMRTRKNTLKMVGFMMNRSWQMLSQLHDALKCCNL